MTALARLAALDVEDLAALSAHIQDAVAKLSDLSWSPRTHRFVLPMNRYAWEARRESQRRRAVVQIDRVTRVRASGVSPRNKDEVISILALMFDPGEAPSGALLLVCAGNVTFRLDVECIEVRLADVGAAWAAAMRPRHALP